MKKFFLLACIMFATTLTFAQEVKRVAILEVVDKQGNVSYANKLILRSSLAKAITNTLGYEAYDRTDMDAIMGEQNFQRTGMVSNDQIKRLGEMTGAKYVLVAEAVLVDEQNMYITAKLLDVETARTEMTDNQMMSTTPKEIQHGCQLLAANLIKPVAATQTVLSNKEKSIQQPIVNEQEKALLATMEKQQPVNVNDTYSLGRITRVSNKVYMWNNRKMSKQAYELFLQNNCPEAWKKYKSGKDAVIAGWTFFGIGLSMVSLYGLCNDWYNHPDVYKTGIILGSMGAAFTGISIPLLGAGYAVKSNAYKVYNDICAPHSSPITLNLTAGQNGLGIALNF